MIDLSVVIVNYNVQHYLEQCLHSVFRALEGLSGEVIVVDNASSDGSVEMLKAHFGDRIVLMANADNPGFARANNQAMRLAQGRYFLLLNPDTIVAEDTFRTCLSYMDAHPKAGALGVYMQDGNGQFLPESKRALPTPWVSFYKIFGLAALFPRSKRFGQYHLTYLDKEQTHEIEILSGAYMWMRKEVLDKVGLLDETYFMYGEDIDLSWRIIQAGYRNVYVAGTNILHYKGESTKKGSLNYVRVFYQAMIIFAKRHFGGRKRLGFIFAIRLAVYLRAFLALSQRLIRRAGFPLLEGVLIYGIMYGIQAYWQHYVKYIEGGQYPQEFTQRYLPAYALVFVTLLVLGGAYKRPFRLRPLLLAPFWGFIGIATATYMFPWVENFSRAIVGLSAVFTSLLSLGLRGLIHWRENGQFFFTEPLRKRVLLVGTPEEVDQASDLIRSSLDYRVDVIGAATSGSPQLVERVGSADQLPALVRLYDVQELIFSNRMSPTSKVLDLMRQMSKEPLEMKILPPEQEVLIGPHAVITAQEGRSLAEILHSKGAQRAKRQVDWVLSTGLLLCFPAMAIGYQRPWSALKALCRVWIGQHSLVGYAGLSTKGLPKLKKAYLSLRDRIGGLSAGEALPEESMNRAYARDYRWELDVEIVWKGWRHIGGR